MFKKVIFALFLGLCIAPFFVQNDAWVHDIVGKQFADIFQLATGCNIDFKVKKINILTPSLQLEHVVVKPADNQAGHWNWQSSSMTVSIS